MHSMTGRKARIFTAGREPQQIVMCMQRVRKKDLGLQTPILIC